MSNQEAEVSSAVRADWMRLNSPPDSLDTFSPNELIDPLQPLIRI
jgi:hypothetical protein